MDDHRIDDFTRLVIEEFKRAVGDQEEDTLPWLNLDVEATRRTGKDILYP